MNSENLTRREHLDLIPAGETALHSTNDSGICKYCGRLWEEIQTGHFRCTGYQKDVGMFKDDEYLKTPRHPLFLDAIIVIRNCGNCGKRREGFCKKHDILRQFLC